MAQPTVTARPATWAGTSAPILYKFTSTNYGNAGYYMAVEVWNSTTAAKIADAKYYANSSGAVTVDVSAFLKSAMSLDNTADLTSGTVYTDGNWVKYYIKYRELWTASSESQVDDVANLRYAVYGGLQLGSANNLSAYTSGTFKFLMLASEGIAIKDYPFLVSWISSITTQHIIKNRYANGVLIDSTRSDDTGNVGGNFFKLVESGSADRIDLTVYNFIESAQLLTNNNFDTDISGWSNAGSGVDWADDTTFTLSFVDTASSKRLEQTFTVKPAGFYRASINAFNTGAGLTTMNFLVEVYNGGSLVQELLNFNQNTTTLQDTGIIEITGDFDRIAFSASYVSGDTGKYAGVDYINFYEQTDTALSEVKTINIKEDCQNTVNLQWRNSLGGYECYPFTYTQEYTWDYGGGKKAKRLTLFANNLTLNQWEAIQGLNTLGDMYRVNITEMTTSLNRTSATIGQSVYVLNSDGTKVGVNVIGQSNTTNTKQKRHSAIVTIEYPELFLQ